MTLFGVGPAELILILVLALVIFGPNRLPEIARTIGKAMNEFRKTSQEVTSAVTRELDLADVTKASTVSAPSVPKDTITAVHTIPLDAVGKVQVVESPYVPPQEEPPEVVTPTSDTAAAEESPSHLEDSQT